MKTLTIILTAALIMNSCVEKKLMNSNTANVKVTNGSASELTSKGKTITIYKKERSKNGMIILCSLHSNY